MSVATETCANCGGAIGALEYPCVWGDYIVCAGCHQRLAGQVQAPPAQSIDTLASAVRTTPTQRTYANATGAPIICPNPNCGYRGRSVRRAKGSALLAMLLLLFWILPGLIYGVFWGGYSLWCPQCGSKVRDETRGERPGGMTFLKVIGIVVLSLLLVAALVRVADVMRARGQP